MIKENISNYLSQHDGLLHIKLTPKASATRLGEFEKDVNSQLVLKAYVTDVPENGKANRALIMLLSKTLKLPKSSFKIIRGETDRNKIVKVQL